MGFVKWNHSLSNWLLLCAAAVLLSACATSAPQEEVSNELIFEVNENTAYLSGVLGDGLVEQLSALVRENPNITELVLVNVPGATNQQAVIDGARLIRRLGLNTRIATTGYVLSGGVDLFLGGVERRIGAGAGVGIHAWTDGTQIKIDNIADTDPVHGAYVNFYLEMGVSDRFYWFSLAAAPAERVYFLSPEEVYDFKLATH
ncbi:alpha/beta hydrolase [Marinomonas sp. C2222]|uniref:Alpha/beta hydrolase n=1 Tax=Marinomonas sargassi TaxID=2984494 RepID=A0ABT2YPS4_9GAMM|nr:alpha/beta hydrolase [Marinomonas sargassi]MCV2401877.1 alpha/beta hydrolase [Marinomonas sargassi]